MDIPLEYGPQCTSSEGARPALACGGSMTDIVRLEVAGWDVWEINGERRVTGTEVGRRLGYYPSKPTTFNDKVIKRGLRAGKFRDIDIVETRRRCKAGFGYREVTEYLLRAEDVLRISMEVQTPNAKRLRQELITSVRDLMIARAASTDSPNILTAGIVAVLDERIREFKKLLERAHGLYVDDEHRHYLTHLASIIVDTRPASKLSDIWIATCDECHLPPGKPFRTVPRTRFEHVHRFLLKQIRIADAEAQRMREAETRRQKTEERRAKKAAASTLPNNVVRLITRAQR